MGVPTTHPILSMLFTHTTPGLPVLFVAAVSFFVSSQRSRSRWFFGVKSSLARPIVEFGVLVFAVLLHLHEKSLTDSNIVSQTTNKQERAFSGSVSLAWRLDREMRKRLILHETGFTLWSIFPSYFIDVDTFYFFLNWFSSRVSDDRNYVYGRRLYACIIHANSRV